MAVTNLRALSWLGWLVCISLALSFAITSIPIQTKLPLLLPSSGSFSEQLLVDQIQSGPTTRILLLGLRGAEAPFLAESSKKLAKAMRNQDLFLHVFNGEQTNLDVDQDLLFQYRYLFNPTLSPDQFTTEGLRQILQHRLQDMVNPLPSFFKKLIPEDPTGAFQSILYQLRSSNPIKTSHGVWFSSDEHVALLVAETAVSGFNLDGQEAIQSFLTASMEDLRATSTPSGASLELLRSGPSVFAVYSRSLIKADAQWLSSLGGGFVVTLLLITFRSFTILCLSLVPLVSGLLVAAITVYIGFGFIHAMTLAFGATLIGVAIDYPLHVCAHLESNRSPRLTILQIWPTIRLGAITTAIGFGAMLFSGFPGLSQLGLFAIAGLFTAAAATRWILPAIAPSNVKKPLVWTSWLPFHHYTSGLMLVVPVSMVLSLAYLGWSEKPFWEMDIAKLSPIPQSLRDRDTWLRQELGTPTIRDIMVVVAPNEQLVLEQSEDFKARLDRFVDRGYISGYEMAADYLPSIRTQVLRQKALPNRATLETRLNEAQQDLPFKPDLFDPFLQSVAKAKRLQPLDKDSVADTPLGMKIHSLLYPHHDQWVATILLREVKDRQALQRAVHSESRFDVHYLDLKAESNRMVTTYRQEVTDYLLIGIGCLILILGLGLRSIPKMMAVLLPIAGSIMLDLALLHALGERLSLFHLAALLLVFGIGLDYTLFFQRSHRTVAERQQTISAIIVCSLTTITVFGLLAWSQTPVLHGIGLTVFLGSLIGFIFAAMCSPVQYQQEP